jgi:hypothetical protein
VHETFLPTHLHARCACRRDASSTFSTENARSAPRPRCGRYFGNDPRFWINLQTQYALALAMREVGARVAREVETAA